VGATGGRARGAVGARIGTTGGMMRPGES